MENYTHKNEISTLEGYRKSNKQFGSSQAMPPYIEWEEEITQIIKFQLDINHGDAQGIIEAQPFTVQQAWGKGLDAKAAAEKIMAASAATPTAPAPATVTPYMTIKAEATKHGLPKYYKEDLTVHDRRLLGGKFAPREFVWILRECGTNLIGKSATDDARTRSLSIAYLDAIAEYNRDARFYLFSNGTLKPATHADCQAFLTN